MKPARELLALGEDATLEIFFFKQGTEFNIRDGSGSCVVLSVAQMEELAFQFIHRELSK